ncbi:MAG: PLP-dependent aminotransferase family protein [Nannocystaceae bacterium]
MNRSASKRSRGGSVPPTRQGGTFPQSATRDDEINLALGQPSPRLLPLDALAKIATRRLTMGADPLVLQYGAALGTAPFRRDLATFLSARHDTDIRSEQLLISAGNSLAMDLLCPLLLRGGAIVCEDPTYFLARDIPRAHTRSLVGLPVDSEGLRVDLLEARLRRRTLRVDVVYCIPTYHNPTGVTLSPGRRRHLVDLAERFDFFIIADEPYNLLHFGAPAPAPLASQDPHERVISLGTFSKILGPGLRLGWFHAAPSLIERIAAHPVLRSGGGLNPVIASIVHGALEDDFLGPHIDGLRGTLGRRASALREALLRSIPSLRVSLAEGGYFLWLDVGDSIRASTLLRESISRGLRFTPGSVCGIEQAHETAIRLSYAFYEEAELEVAAERLARALAATRSG